MKSQNNTTESSEMVLVFVLKRLQAEMNRHCHLHTLEALCFNIFKNLFRWRGISLCRENGFSEYFFIQWDLKITNTRRPA